MAKDGSYHYHDTETKSHFIGAMLVKENIKENAATFRIPYETARKIWKKYKDTGSVENRPRSGRPKTITPRMEHQIHEKALRNRRKPFTDIANEINPPISAKSVARVMAKDGYHRRVGRKVPFLTVVQKCQREAWAKANSTQDWTRVMWSDECYVHLDDKNGQIYVTRRPEEVWDEECLVPTFKQSNIRVMIWGCVADGWKGPLVVLEYPGGKGGGMTAARYQEQVLEGHLVRVMKQLGRRRYGLKFQQDGAPSHKAKSTHKWFSDHDIPLFPHPSSSPDLSPIEPVWHELKARIRAHLPRPTTFEGLKAVVLAEWEKLPIEAINRHTGRMRERVEAVLEAKGGHTKF
jgi:transposase